MEAQANTRKEKQHYVPKFLLRYFSYQGNEKQIGVFNTNSGFIRKDCALRDQAYKPYYYGKDGEIEDLLSQGFEGPGSLIIREIIRSENLPPQHSSDYFKLLEFIMLTYLRTPKLEQRADDSTSRLKKMLQDTWAEGGHDISELDMKTPGKLYENMSRLRPCVIYTSDLRISLIINNTDTPFLISDNPLIKYNQFMESRGFERGATGLSSLGLQLFFCFSPRHCLFLHDPWIYKSGSKSGPNVISSISPRDVYQINLLTFLNCDNQVFFNHQFTYEQIQEYFEVSKKFHKSDEVRAQKLPRHRVRLTGPEALAVNDSDNGFFYTVSHLSARIKLTLSFVTQTKQAKKLSINLQQAAIARKSFDLADRIVKKHFD